MKVNTKKLKSLLTLQDYEKILQDLNIPIYSKTKQQWIYWTGDKNIDALRGSPKLYFYPDTKIYFGYTAGRSYDIIALVQARLEITKQAHSFVDAINFILASTGIDSDVCQRITKKNTYNWEDTLSKYLKIKSGISTLKTYDETILEQLPDIYPQSWIDEGITIDTMIKYGIKYYPRLQATVIPCRDKEGNLIGIRCRHWLPEEIERGKYRPLQLLNNNIYSFPTNKVFYGINYNWAEIERTKTAIVVESEKAVMQLDTWYHEKNIALGMFGNKLSLTQKKDLLALGVSRVIYVVDNDWIGREEKFFETWKSNINKFINAWEGYAQVEIVWDNLGLLNPKENATDHNLDTWEKLYEAREIIAK